MGRSLNSIAAVCQNMGIGKNGDLPWPPLRNEFKYFQKMTTTPTVEGKQNVLIMGKKTWFSIPENHRPLKGRINIVLSRDLKETPKGAHYLAGSLDDALVLLDSPELASKIDLVWIVGGSAVYKVQLEHQIRTLKTVNLLFLYYEGFQILKPECPFTPVDIVKLRPTQLDLVYQVSLANRRIQK
uniref:Dihydrofolate reductase n=1 Tax=Sphenodon punctatus TaxID=8508 RepID=A0A8D0G5D7_SPHPU